MQSTRPNLNRRSTRQFIRHYVEMVVVMVIGMIALSVPADAVLDLFGTRASDAHPTTMLATMAVTMTVPMVAWMRYRGHSWRVNAEMAAAMVIPAVAAICLQRTAVLTETMTLMIVEHAAMLACMLIAMLARRDEYSTGHGHGVSHQVVAA